MTRHKGYCNPALHDCEGHEFDYAEDYVITRFESSCDHAFSKYKENPDKSYFYGMAKGYLDVMDEFGIWSDPFDGAVVDFENKRKY